MSRSSKSYYLFSLYHCSYCASLVANSSFYLIPYFVYASSEDSGKTSSKDQILMCWLIDSTYFRAMGYCE